MNDANEFFQKNISKVNAENLNLKPDIKKDKLYLTDFFHCIFRKLPEKSNTFKILIEKLHFGCKRV